MSLERQEPRLIHEHDQTFAWQKSPNLRKHQRMGHATTVHQYGLLRAGSIFVGGLARHHRISEGLVAYGLGG